MPINISQFPLTTVVDASSKIVWLDPTVTTGQVTSGAGGTEFLMGASDSLNRLLPPQSGQTGKVLGTNGAVPSWVAGGGGGSPFVGAGTGHAAGQVPDPGATAHGTPYVLGDDGAFHPMLGSGLSYSGGGYTFSGGTGGAGTVTQITAGNGLSGGVITGIGTVALIAPVTVPNGGTGLIALPTANQVLGVNAGATAYEGKTLTAGANITITPSAGALTIAGTGGGSAATLRVFGITSFGQTATGTTPMSLFTGGSPGFAVDGSLSIPANTLRAGSQIEMGFGGGCKFNAPDTMTMTLLIGGVVVMTGTSAALATLTTEGEWFLKDLFCSVTSVSGTTATMRGGATFVGATSASAGTGSIYLTSGGLGGVSAAVTVNPTIALPIDLQVSFSSTNVVNQVRVFRGYAKVLL